jgi:GNAT superfamily N-acetyltransferase
MTKPVATDFRIEALNKTHDRAGFTCGVDALDHYLKAQAAQDFFLKECAVFVLRRERDPGHMLGYYTLCTMTLSPGQVPEAADKHIPPSPLVRCTMLRELAITAALQGQGLGSVLLVDALRRALVSADVFGSSMVVANALNETATGFYAAHGFIPLPAFRYLVLPMRQVEAGLGNSSAGSQNKYHRPLCHSVSKAEKPPNSP